MKNSIIHLVRYAKSKGYVVSVYDGGEWAVKKSSNEKEIMDAINSVDEAEIVIRDPNQLMPGSDKAHKRIGWAMIVNGLDNDELVADHSANEFFDGWTKAYQEDNKTAAA